ncbi:MAG: DASS family sodium-coupled anion symporter [Burkholderiaceae bacterium]
MPNTQIQIGTFSPRSKRFALVFGPLLALALYFVLPSSYIDPAGQEVAFTTAGRATLSVVLWMALWWFSEAVPIAVTALLPIVLFPLLGIASPAKTTAPYASDIIFLFLGGFLIAAGIQKWGLDRRIAMRTLSIVGTQASHVVGGLMLATAFVSMWVSNTATAAMMVPIAIAVMGVVRSARGGEPDVCERNFGVSVLLAVAYGASIGGMATIIGSPPNGIFVRFVEQTYGDHVSVVDWMRVGLPVTLIMLPLTWLLLTKVLFRNSIGEVAGGRDWVRGELEAMGSLTRGERVVLTVFTMTVLLWIFGPLLRGMEIGGAKPLARLSDSVIAMIGGIALFTIPVKPEFGIRALDWDASKNIPWDVLLLFGGGLSMAAAIQANGAAGLIGAQAAALSDLPTLGVVLGVATLVVFATEFTSNTALAATMLPLLAAAAPALGVPPETLLLVTALGASAAFMMPVATPPNAIIFGTGMITIGQMVRAGFLLNIVAIIVVTLIATWLGGDLITAIQQDASVAAAAKG